ncbi:SEC-C metal-binding domain-containing protein [Cohnella silvisoli]|uniref:SEC-C metal-binding domain-containing protein n=1 Tax=Cohnella silvisoli TaxID=2873699 RepID=A0ABV1KTK7_9BACL|nr:SEC-C metal-binding domain-containing protein [Cohnella silvisoli]MCD9022843.1 SEC-C domain-containing protein [Cohnella silvisoli]
MLNPQLVKPYILHEDLQVVNFAIKYFSESYLYDEELLPLVLKRLRKVKSGETFYIHHAYDFPHTPNTLSDIMDLMNSNLVDAQTQIHLSQILLNADTRLLESILLDLSAYSDKLAQAAKEKIELAKCPDEQLVELFGTFIEQATDKYYNEIDVRYGESLVKHIARRGSISENYVLDTLASFHPDNSYGYKAIFYSKLAGEMRLASAIPFLNNFMSWDEDVLPDVASKALIKIGSEDVIHQVADLFASQSDGYYRLFASDIFGHIKSTSSEDALCKLLEQEEDVSIATMLADGLCQLGSRSAIPIVLKQIQDGYDSQVLDLRESLYVNCILNEVDLPEFGDWKRAFQKEDQEWKRRSAGFFGTQITNKETKIGRNDPCTCGSGKKYKKCCGAN